MMVNRFRAKFLVLMSVCVLVLAVAAPTALAQSGQDGYGADGPSVLGQTEGNGNEGGDAPSQNCADNNGSNGGNSGSNSSGDNCKTATVSKAGGDELPFTGMDVALVAFAGAALLGVGVGMRRLTRAPDAA